MNEEGKKPQFRIWILVVLSASAVLALVLSSIRGIEVPYVSAAELASVKDRNVRVAGKVAVGGIESDGAGDVSIRFALIDDKGDTVTVDYTGVRPDAFREGAQAVAEGNFDASRGVFLAEILQAKCPSKYEVGVAAAPKG